MAYVSFGWEEIQAVVKHSHYIGIQMRLPWVIEKY
jgi:hypothetical protein